MGLSNSCLDCFSVSQTGVQNFSSPVEIILRLVKMKAQLQLLLSCSLLVAVVGDALSKENPVDIISNFIREDVKAWEAPADLSENYVYYWSGSDEEGRPLWILELGKWDIRSIVLNGSKTIPDFDKYVDQAVFNVLQSLNLNSTDLGSFAQVTGIVDMENFNYAQLASGPTVEYILRKFSYLVPVMYKYVNHAYLVNTNFYAEKLLDLLRPILGSIMERVEVFGTNKSRWMPRLLKTLPKNQLPPWYGGDKIFVPLKVYGK